MASVMRWGLFGQCVSRLCKSVRIMPAISIYHTKCASSRNICWGWLHGQNSTIMSQAAVHVRRHLCSSALADSSTLALRPPGLDPPSEMYRVHHEPPNEQPSSLPIKRLQHRISNYGHLNIKHMLREIGRIAYASEIAEEGACWLIKASGHCLTQHTVAERQKAYRYVLNVLKPRLKNYTIEFQNALFSARLENEDYFDPLMELEAIKEMEGIEPNKVTYQLMIHSYCLQGNVESAKLILEYMKSLEMVVTEQVLQSLIMGYMKQGDIAGAKDIADLLMREVIHDESQTYTLLLCGAAALGNFEQFKKFQLEAVEKNVIFMPKQIFNLLTILGKHHHHEVFSQILGSFVENSHHLRYYAEAMNCVYKLGALNEDDLARKVFDIIPNERDEDNAGGDINMFKVKYAKDYIESLIRQGKPLQMVIDTYQSLANVGLLEVERDLSDTRTKIYRLSRSLKKQKESDQYDWSFRVEEMTRDKDLQKMLSFVQSTYLNDSDKHFSEAFERCRTFLQETDLKEGEGHFLKEMKKLGFSDRLIRQCNIRNQISLGNFKVATDLARNLEVFECGVWEHRTFEAGIRKFQFDYSDIEDMMQFIRVTKQFVISDFVYAGLCRHMVLYTIDVTDCSGQVAVKLLKNYLDHDVVIIPDLQILHIKKSLREKNVAEDMIQNLSDELFNTRQSEADVSRVTRTASMTQDSPIYKSLKEYVMDNSAAAAELTVWERNKIDVLDLDTYLCEGKVKEANALVERLKGSKFVIDTSILTMLKILKYKDSAKDNQFGSVKIGRSASVEIARHFMLKQKFELALTAIKLMPAAKCRYSKLKIFLDALGNLPEDRVDFVRSALNILEKDLRRDSILHFRVKFMLAVHSNNSKEVWSLCKSAVCRTSDKAPPIIIEYFIRNEDMENLQKVVDVMSSYLSKNRVLHEIGIAFLNCQRPEEATKVLQLPNLKFQKLLVKDIFHRLSVENQLHTLEQYVEMTEGCMLKGEREYMLFLLIKELCTKENDVDKALQVLTRCKVEGITLAPAKLQYLATWFKENGKPVPFDVPSIPVLDGPSC